MKETLYYNGTILTMDEKNPKTQAVLVKNGTIKAVGTYEELKGHGEEVDLHGKTMLPGFIDGHSHIGMACLFPMFYPSPAGNINSVESVLFPNWIPDVNANGPFSMILGIIIHLVLKSVGILL